MIDIKQLLEESLELEYLTNDFAVVAIDIAKKQINRRQDIPASAREEALGRFTVKFVEKWQKIKPEGNIKSYISTMAYTSLMDELRKFKRYHIDDRENLEKNNCWPHKNELIIFSNVLKEAEIQSGNQLSVEQREVLKREVMKMHRAGMSSRHIAKQIGISKSCVNNWVKWYKTRGPQFWGGKRRGRPKSV